MERRTFVTGALGTTADLALPFAGTPEAIGTAHVSELRDGLRSLFSLDDCYGGGDVRPLAVRHLQRVRRIINTSDYPDPIGRQLHLLAGETAEHCAWLSFDAGEQERARRYWGDALSVATMLRDDGLEVLVLAGLSLQALHEGRSREAHDFARAARQRAQPLGSPTLVSLIAAREARALAQMSELQRSRRVLAEAMRVANRDSGRPAPQWASFHGHAELDFAQGVINAEVGHHGAAVPFLRAAITHQDLAAFGRNRALYQLTLAHSLIQAGEVEEGASKVGSTLDQLPEVRSGRVSHKLIAVRDALAETDTAVARDTAGEITARLT